MNNSTTWLCVALLFLACSALADDAPPTTLNIGDVVFSETFAESDGVKISLPANGAERHTSITRAIPVAPLRGLRLRVTGTISATNVATPPNPWNGVKMMLVLESQGGTQWLQQDGLHGTFAARRVAFTANVPDDATSATLVLGLEETTGEAVFRDIRISVVGKKPVPRLRDSSHPIYTGHTEPRLRGAMVAPDSFRAADLDVIAGEWKANHLRWQLLWDGFPNGPADTATVEEFNAWIERQCQQLDAILPHCKKYGVRIALDLHTPPGGRLLRERSSAMPLFTEAKWQAAFVATWEKLARRYKDNPAIWGYDLLNEPVEGDAPEDDSVLDWRALALKTSRAIRAIDSDRAIIIEPAPWGNPNALAWFGPLENDGIENVVYSVHMYLPHKFTHQGVYDAPTGLVYPGEIEKQQWNKAKLRAALHVPITYAKTYGVAIYIGEFSAIRWAPDGSACRYLSDCIEIFEEEGWDWAYHAFREWDGWSVEHSGDKNDHNRATMPTDREQLLRRYFGLNGANDKFR